MANEITNLLVRWNHGDQDALGELMPLVYPRLRTIAGAVFSGTRDETNLQPTPLVHETYLRLLGQTLVGMADREHFFGFAAQCMRRVLVSHFRARHAETGRSGSSCAIAR